MTETTRLTVEQPYDGAVIDELAYAPWPDVDAMLARATAAFADRDGWLPAHKRIEVLQRLAGLMRDRTGEFALLIAREGGKPLTDARIEAERAVTGVELAAEGIADLHGQEIPMDLTAAGASRLAFTRKEPIGPVVAVSAFNHPLNLIVHQVAPAIATGCPVIIKPADTTPLSCLKFVGLVHEAGLPEELCQVCVCDIPTAERLVTDPRVAFFSFIGSSRVGWYQRSKLAPGTRCALEHGGAAPVIVSDDADLELAIPSLVKGGYYHAGQVCVSVQRIFVDNQLKEDFCSAYSAEVARLETGDPTLAETDVGPLILPREVDRVATWVDEAVSDGAQILAGGAPLTERVYDPTILVEPPADAKISTLEVFGPVSCVYGFDNTTDALARANGLPLAFQAAVYTANLDRALGLSSRLDAGAVMVNDHSAFRVDWMPFAGRRTSGYGVGGIHHTMADMTQEKMTVIRSPAL
ncbi:MAG: aldehyde dehydrogenase family protein [Alphaproteobacteria bacterium]|nr:aldehyde dehydrogenase family protein [Alphaproteobacteria bacterium]